MTQSTATTPTLLHWLEADGMPCAVRWRSEKTSQPPARVVLADDTLPADTAYRLACEGTALLWRGDFHNARQLLQALERRIARGPRKSRTQVAPTGAANPAQAFYQHRQAQAQRARVLGLLLVPVAGDYSLPLRRAPDLRTACAEAWGPATGEDSVVALRELLGLVGAHEWRKKGVEIPMLAARIHPHYGVFSPVRGEYIELLAQAPFPTLSPSPLLAFDIGVGTGVLSAVLAQRGVRRIVATDCDPRALACARDNLERLGLSSQVELLQTDLFPPGRAPLVVCNPPWVPARPAAPIEHAVYDEDSRMLRGFLGGLAGHLEPGGEGWLILSDLAEHLGLRPRAELLAWIDCAGLRVLGRADVRPRHPKAHDAADPLYAARAREVTSLWRLGVR